MGRDVVASLPSSEWDNFQCKHYNHPLQPSDIWSDIGKFLYHCQKGQFTYPRRYSFAAPQYVGTTLARLLKDPNKLKADLKANWAKYCAGTITTTHTIHLTGGLLSYIEAADFSIFGALTPLSIIEDHRKTPWHTARFGGGLPERPPILQPPTAIDSIELKPPLAVGTSGHAVACERG
jgi:hypothetical protein